ncbi:MAG: Phosphopantetheine adenylyltransferase [candidate division WS2 bacterium]|uniref:Phosphopantetheine adenylyltransferase n=1 Tax=Psychracetigena formicireducens TaxID=2986056 RepID=A0A9E2BF60_PSYF1|nr:Phosphopantetheine adenylyltransferase [Candidatus Psychracetigena formicireducens]MBT9144470.1 Phosphopantetheine adenylyltransferase [Candidatus Psychracetigena formicireducens]MBT9149992.1 Phosphopantetheine adenylyltransferase [Candidatus Psychracetigena formicireducens]
MKKAVYAGTFDPITMGHLDVIERVARIFDFLYIGIAAEVKKQVLFSAEERYELVKETTKHLKNVEAHLFSGLLVEFVKSMEAKIIIRGLRALSDFEYEFEIASANKNLYPEVDTLFLLTSLEYSFLSSSLVKEVAMLGGSVEKWVPPVVDKKLRDKYKSISHE